ncbi:hypothetical protein M9H77_30356 [Catharanthus roseus]|uniref:Uncharacterized protein n=1 Tax=Catharanthus roseus TaxID=4058 RepID=A0ACB9ZXB9_CATRO|nr:hypothetical protein M9H77_30356 [Catharanthus roseus]
MPPFPCVLLPSSWLLSLGLALGTSPPSPVHPGSPHPCTYSRFDIKEKAVEKRVVKSNGSESTWKEDQEANELIMDQSLEQGQRRSRHMMKVWLKEWMSSLKKP